MIAYVVTLVVSWSSGRFQEACWHIVGCIATCMAGAVLMIATLNTGARYFGLILLCSGPFVGLNVCPTPPIHPHLWSPTDISLASTFLGNDGGASASYQACSAGRFRQLRLIHLPLVLALLLPTLPGAPVSKWWWHHHCRLRVDYHLLSYH